VPSVTPRIARLLIDAFRSLLRFCRNLASRDAIHCRLVFAERVLSNVLSEAQVDRSIIGIKSAYKWPEPIVIDTNLPTIVPSLPVLAKAPIINQPQDTFAQLKSPLPKASEYSVRAKRKVAAQIRPARIAAYRAIPEALPAGW
jgi:hypothetical protein